MFCVLFGVIFDCYLCCFVLFTVGNCCRFRVGFGCSAWLCGCLALRLWLLVLLVASAFWWFVSGLCLDFDLVGVGVVWLRVCFLWFWFGFDTVFVVLFLPAVVLLTVDSFAVLLLVLVLGWFKLIVGGFSLVVVWVLFNCMLLV